MNDSDLLSAADQAFAVGNNQAGLALLREYSFTDTANLGSWHRLAVVEEQIGDWTLAGKAHYKCIELAPHFAAGYIFAGYWLEKSGMIDAATALYSLAQDADPASLIASPANGTDPTEVRAAAANSLLRSELSRQHRELCARLPQAGRIQDAIWLRTHDAPCDFTESQSCPDLFYIPGLDGKPVYESKEFTWAAQLIENASVIKKELYRALEQEAGQQSVRPYLDDEFAAPGALQNLAGSRQWAALDLFKDGVDNSAICEYFPRTLSLIGSIPTYSMSGQHPVEVFFSMLQPHQEIAPHYGPSNHSLTVHLALDIPDNCYLQVAGEKYQWQEGELLMFDDSYLHSAHNQSDRLRIVLIFSVWHPALTIEEQGAIQASFRMREQWMTARRSKLAKLLPGAT